MAIIFLLEKGWNFVQKKEVILLNFCKEENLRNLASNGLKLKFSVCYIFQFPLIYEQQCSLNIFYKKKYNGKQLWKSSFCSTCSNGS